MSTVAPDNTCAAGNLGHAGLWVPREDIRCRGQDRSHAAFGIGTASGPIRTGAMPRGLLAG